MNKRFTHIIAGIITFNPEMNRLIENIERINPQVNEIVIFDNNSDNLDLIENVSRKFEVTLIKASQNRGIAFGLNMVMDFAESRGYFWVVTLDQDSVVPEEYLDNAYPLLSRTDIGIIVPVLYESASGEVCLLGEKRIEEKYQIVHKNITSGSITNVDVWRKTGGFDETLFIDYVDYDYAMKLQQKGYKIIRMNHVYLDHKIGNSRCCRFLLWNIRVAEHSSFRKYYIGRNMVIYMKRYKNVLDVKLEFMRLLKVPILIMLFEKDKKEKMFAFFIGLRDGCRYKENKIKA